MNHNRIALRVKCVQKLSCVQIRISCVAVCEKLAKMLLLQLAEHFMAVPTLMHMYRNVYVFVFASVHSHFYEIPMSTTTATTMTTSRKRFVWMVKSNADCVQWPRTTGKKCERTEQKRSIASVAKKMERTQIYAHIKISKTSTSGFEGAAYKDACIISLV